MKKLHKIFKKNLHNFFLWFCIWTKRFFLKPFFLFTLLLIPGTAFFLQKFSFSDAAVLRIAICTDGKKADSISRDLEKKLLSLSDSSVQFYHQTSKEKICQDISTGKAVSGYILPADLETRLKKYAKEKKPFLTAVQKKEEMSNQIVNEILLSKLYQTHAFQVLVNFISEKGTSADIAFLEDRFQSYQKHQLLFRFEYADGTENKLLNKSSTGLLLMPFRGFISVLLFLACMVGILMGYADRKTGFSLAIHPKKKTLCLLFPLFIPAVLSGITGIISICFTEIAEPLQTEIISMFCFLFACTSLTFFFSCIIKSREVFLSFLPILTIGSLFLCPVFIDISMYSPVFKILRCLFPVHYYLRSFHSKADLFCLILYGSIFLFSGMLLKRIFKNDFQKL